MAKKDQESTKNKFSQSGGRETSNFEKKKPKIPEEFADKKGRSFRRVTSNETSHQ